MPQSVPSFAPSRRSLLVGAALAAPFLCLRRAEAAPREAIALPYDDHALEPVISANTLGFHYGKHYKGYLANLAKLTANSDLAEAPLEKVIAFSAGAPDKTALFNNAAQAWNHEFYWKSLKPNGGGAPPAALAQRIDAGFGSLDALKQHLSADAISQFGSGWAWLVEDNGHLKVVKTSNANTPLTEGKKPLLTLDVWEHAYYLDYQNRRADYVNAVIDKLINWEFALSNLA